MFSSRRRLAETNLKITGLKEALLKARVQRDFARTRLAGIKSLTNETEYREAARPDLDARDLVLIESLKNTSASPLEAGLVVDYTGCRISPKHFPSIAGKSDAVLGLPVPDDGILHHYLEYVGLALALDLAAKSSSSRKIFRMIELGAGNGIWSTRGALCALRLDFEQVDVCCVEADREKFLMIQEQFELNGLWNQPALTVRQINSPVTADGRNVFFPAANDGHDFGVAIADSHDTRDYRGHSVAMEERESVSVDEVLRCFEIVDFASIDIQGAELEIVTRSVEALASKIRVMVVGTHSRLIEGQLIECLYANGFSLHAEKPCMFHYSGHFESLAGRIVSDGEQIWVNDKFAQLTR